MVAHSLIPSPWRIVDNFAETLGWATESIIWSEGGMTMLMSWQNLKSAVNQNIGRVYVYQHTYIESSEDIPRNPSTIWRTRWDTFSEDRCR